MNFAERDRLRDMLITLSETGRFDPGKSASATYLDGTADVLQLLGLVAIDEQRHVQAKAETARLFLRSMAAHLADDLPLALNWESPRGEEVAAHGTELLAEVELLRSDSVANPTPVRTIKAVNAIITAHQASEIYLLMQYDERARQFQLIGGKIEPDDRDAAHALLREMQEELELSDLNMPRDLILIPLAERFEKVSLSPTFGVVTSYAIRFFHVQRLNFMPAVNNTTRWISLEEMRHGSLTDGRKVSDLALQSLNGVLETLEPSTIGPIQVD